MEYWQRLVTRVRVSYRVHVRLEIMRIHPVIMDYIQQMNAVLEIYHQIGDLIVTMETVQPEGGVMEDQWYQGFMPYVQRGVVVILLLVGIVDQVSPRIIAEMEVQMWGDSHNLSICTCIRTNYSPNPASSNLPPRGV